MKKKSVRLLAAGLSAAMLLTQSLPGVVLGAPDEGQSGLTAFEQAFMNAPDKENGDKDAKPFMRWWIAPGRMTKEEIEKEIKAFKDGGYAGVELQCLELAKDCVINDATWNQTMKWILQAGIDNGVQIDCTLGQLWPIASPDIENPDEEPGRAEQQIFEGSKSFTASEGAMVYNADALVLPEETLDQEGNPIGFNKKRKYSLVAVTAAKVSGNGFDTKEVYNVLGDSKPEDIQETGKVTWTAPSSGEWKIFYYYSQASMKTVNATGQYVVDHMSEEGTQVVIDSWEKAMEETVEGEKLGDLYRENGGSVFGDSFELSTGLWTPKMLEEFKKRRGYDLTPYLPATTLIRRGWNTVPANEFGDVGERIREDLYSTMTELMSENHMSALQDWAKTHNMTLRYQAYSSSGPNKFELTHPAQYIDTIEAESYAMSGDTPDAYRQLSGMVHMKGDKVYSAEAAEIGSDDWRETWTKVQTRDGREPYNGFVYYANRLFAGGVNKMVFHGTTYKVTDLTDLERTVEWPGYSAMAGMGYGNEWDDKTPMWDNVDIMTDYLTRTGYALQQGTADMDLAVYRDIYGKGGVRNEITDLEKAGYTYDYVTPTILDHQNATTGKQDGKTVLAADGPSYKALIIEPMSDGTIPPMPLATAEKIVAAANEGLPVVIIGELPSRASYHPGSTDKPTDVSTTVPDENAALADCLKGLEGKDNVKKAADRAGAVKALAELGVTPDTQPESPSGLYYQHRNTSNAELYYIYNGDSKDSDQKITLKGEGAPYLLDPWSGEISPIAEYTVDENSVTICPHLDEQDAMLVAVAKPGWSSKAVERNVTETDGDAVLYDAGEGAVYKLGVQSAKGGDVSVKFDDGTKSVMEMDIPESKIQLTNWKMVLNQWTKGKTVHETSVVPTKEYDLSASGLKPWYEIDSNLTNVAGVADYTVSFTLEKGWAEGQGAYLDFTRVSDVGRLFVNDHEVPMNQISLHTDIGKYLNKGSNTIKVEVSSNMSNVKYAKDTEEMRWGMPTGNIIPAAALTYAFGIIGDVTLTPYTYMAVEEVAQNASKRADKAEAEAAAAKADAEKQVNEANAAKAEAEANLKKAQENADELKRQADAKAQEVANAQNATEQQRKAAEQAKAAADAAQKELAAARADLKKAQEKADRLTFQARKITLSKVTSPKKKQAKVTWKKVSGATGYQIQYSTKSNFKGKKTLTVNGGKKTSAVIKKLSSKKKYYVRIRAYKKIGGKNAYTAYSAKKSVKVK